MKSVFWEVGTSFFHKFSCLEWKFRTVQNTKKHEKLTIFRLFLFVTFRFSFFVYISLFIAKNWWKVFSEKWEQVFFQKFSCLKKKFRTVQNTKKHEKLTIFRLFLFVTFHFFSTFLCSLLRTDEKCFLRCENKFFFTSFHALSESFVRYKTQKNMKN